MQGWPAGLACHRIIKNTSGVNSLVGKHATYTYQDWLTAKRKYIGIGEAFQRHWRQARFGTRHRFLDHNRRRAIRPLVHQPLSYGRPRAAAHVKHKRRLTIRQPAPVEVGRQLALSRMPRHEPHRMCVIAVGQRHTEFRRHRRTGGDTRDKGDCDPLSAQLGDLFTGPSEHQDAQRFFAHAPFALHSNMLASVSDGRDVAGSRRKPKSHPLTPGCSTKQPPRLTLSTDTLIGPMIPLYQPVIKTAKDEMRARSWRDVFAAEIAVG